MEITSFHNDDNKATNFPGLLFFNLYDLLFIYFNFLFLLRVILVILLTEANFNYL